jgi:nitrogen fixation protein NifU and related proteins
MDPLYQENILDHYKHPHNRAFMEHADVTQKGHNASCGDDLTLYLKWEGEKLSAITFEGFGCAISQSGASMLTDKVKGMTRAEMSALGQGTMYELYGVEIGPQREKCAMLAMNTLQEAIKIK